MDDRTEINKPASVLAAPRAAAAAHAHQRFEKATDMLIDEHRVIERVLAVLQKLTRKPVEDYLHSWKQALDFCSRFADQCHHLKEEKLLFPAMEERGIPKEGGPIGMMLIEHEEGRAHVRSMRASIVAVEAKNEAAKEFLVKSALAYVHLLTDHIRKEDEILFPMADGVIDPHAQRQLLKTFEEHELNEMGTGVHEKYLKVIEELENHHRY